MSSEKSPPRRRRSTLKPRTATKTAATRAPIVPSKTASGQNARPRPPEPGAIIDYGYLWAREDANGQENATKTRPCYIYGVKPIDRLYIVSVMAISSSSTGARVPVHPRERSALGLPDDCDVVIEEVNVFQWSGPDIVPQSDGSLTRANPASKKLTAAIGTAMVGRTPTIVFRAP